MAVLTIARMGHPILRRRAETVSDPTAADIACLVANMLETLAEVKGLGLAAPQVRVAKRVVLFEVPRSRAENPEAPDGSPDGPVPPTVLINPEIVPLGDRMEIGWEECLSVPGLAGAVPRHRDIRYRGLTLEGGVIERTATGFHARVVQHECDHLDGILYPQRMSDLTLLGFVKEIKSDPPPIGGMGAAA